MLAYNLLYKNLGVPPMGMPGASTNDEPPPSVEEQRKALGEKLVEAVYRQERDHRALFTMKFPDEKPKERFTPIDLLAGVQRSHAHASRQQRLLLPERAPAGLSPETILRIREGRIQRRAQQRLEELESMMDEAGEHNATGLENMPLGRLVDEHYQLTLRTASAKRLREIIQLKALRLRDKQAKVWANHMMIIVIYLC